MERHGNAIRNWALFAAAALATAAAWYGLYAYEITLAPTPDLTGLGPEQADVTWYAWYREGAWQDFAILLISAIGFLGFSGLGAAMARREANATDTPSVSWGTAGRVLVVAGLLGATAQLTLLGGRQAVVAATATLDTLGQTSLIAYFVTEIGNAFQFGAFGLLGVGALASVVAARGVAAGIVWSGVGVALGAASILVGVSRLLDDPTGFADPVLLVAGVVLLPAWAVGLDRATHVAAEMPAGHTAAVATR